MTAASWLTAGQTVVFLAVCGYAWWAARLIAEAADSSAEAADRAVAAADDAKRAATDIRAMRDMLQAWLDEQHTSVSRSGGAEEQETAASAHPVRTDTAETHAVITAAAIIGRHGMDVGERMHEDAATPHRGRHAHRTAPPSGALPRWTAAVRAAASRTRGGSGQQSDGEPAQGPR